MSGPKSGSYSVSYAAIRMQRLAEERRREAQRVAAQEKLRGLLGEIATCRRELASLRDAHKDMHIAVDVASVPAQPPEKIEDIQQEQARCQQIHNRLRAERDKVAGILELDRIMASALKAADRARAAENKPARETTAEQLQAIAARATAAIGNLPAALSDSQRAEIESAMQLCIETGNPAAAELRLTNMRVMIHKALAEAALKQEQKEQQQQQESAAACDLLARLDVLGNAASEELRLKLRAVSAGQTTLDEALRKDAEAAIKNSESGYAGHVLKQTLEEMGYDVQEGFETLFDQGGQCFFQQPDWDEHYVRVSIDPQRQRLNLDMVHYGTVEDDSSAQAAKDTAMEEQWCGQVSNLMEHLSERGLTIDLTRKLAPGAIKQQVIADARLKPTKTHAKAQIERKTEQERSAT